jgi:hypothetical protein
MMEPTHLRNRHDSPGFWCLDRGDSGGGCIELSHSDQLLYCRLMDRRAARSDRGPRRSRRRRQQSLPHGTQITPSTVTCQSACAEAEDLPSRGGALRSSFREPQVQWTHRGGRVARESVDGRDLYFYKNMPDGPPASGACPRRVVKRPRFWNPYRDPVSM